MNKMSGRDQSAAMAIRPEKIAEGRTRLRNRDLLAQKASQTLR